MKQIILLFLFFTLFIEERDATLYKKAFRRFFQFTSLQVIDVPVVIQRLFFLSLYDSRESG